MTKPTTKRFNHMYGGFIHEKDTAKPKKGKKMTMDKLITKLYERLQYLEMRENEPDYPHEKIKADIRIIREILGWIE